MKTKVHDYNLILRQCVVVHACLIHTLSHCDVELDLPPPELLVISQSSTNYCTIYQITCNKHALVMSNLALYYIAEVSWDVKILEKSRCILYDVYDIFLGRYYNLFITHPVSISIKINDYFNMSLY